MRQWENCSFLMLWQQTTERPHREKHQFQAVSEVLPGFFSHRNQDSDSIKMTHVSILKDIWGGDGLSYFTTKFGFLKPQPQKWSRRVLRNPFLILFPLSSFYVYLVMINNKILLVNLRVLSLKLQLEIRHAMTWNDCNILLFISKIPFHIINMW